MSVGSEVEVEVTVMKELVGIMVKVSDEAVVDGALDGVLVDDEDVVLSGGPNKVTVLTSTTFRS